MIKPPIRVSSLDQLKKLVMSLPNGDIAWSSCSFHPKNDHEVYVQVLGRKRFAILPLQDQDRPAS